MASSSLGRASAVLASGTLVSRILGFVMSLVFTTTIGIVGGADSFTNANQLPNTIYTIIAGGALNAVLVPQIVKSALHADGGRGYVNKLVTLALSVLLVVAVLATVLAAPLTTAVAFTLPQPQLDLAIAFAYWCLPQIFFYGLYTILGEVLNARGSFGPFTWAPAINNVVTIAGLVVFGALFGSDPGGVRPPESWTPDMIILLAGSATLGVALQALILIPFWRRVGLRFRPDFHFRGVGLRTAGKLASWSFATLAVTLVAGVIEGLAVAEASGANASSTVMQKSWLIFMLPHSIIAVSVATAYYTRMSGHASVGRWLEFRSDISTSLRVVGMLLTFSAAALIICAPSFAVVFSPGNSRAAAQMTLVIIASVVVLPFFSSLSIIQRAFYALDDARTPFVFTLVQSVVVVVGSLLALLLVPLEIRAVWVAVSMSVSIAVQALLAGLLLRRRLGGSGGATVVTRYAQYTVAAIPTLVVGFIVFLLLEADGFATDNPFSAVVAMAIIGVVMAAVYFGVLWLMRVPELRAFAAPVLARIRR